MKQINRVLEGKAEFIKHCQERIAFKFPKTEPFGIIYFEPVDMQKRMEPFFADMGIKGTVKRIWVHFMRKGSNRIIHEHTHDTGLLYLVIPPGSGKLKIHKKPDDEIIEPIEDNFLILPKNTSHSITQHNSEIDRLAMAMDIQYEEGREQEN